MVDNPVVSIIAPAPPPVTGQSAYFLYLQKILDSQRFRFFPLHARALRSGLDSYVRKIGVTVRTVFQLMTSQRSRSALMVIDSGPGLVLNIILILVLRAQRSNIFISHHTFHYVSKTTLLMRALVAAGGSKLCHVFLCDCMSEAFRRRYAVKYFMNLNNARRVALGDAVGSEPNVPTEFVVGYISNVSFEKGIAEFVGAYKALRRIRGEACRAVVAGPAASREVEDYLRRQVAEVPGLSWIGPVYGDQKTAFFRSLSVLIFPTFYAREAQPNVIFEALSFGVPVISNDIGCIGEDLSPTSGVAVQLGGDFEAQCLAKLTEWEQFQARGEWTAISTGARARYEELRDQALADEQRLIDYLLSGVLPTGPR